MKKYSDISKAIKSSIKVEEKYCNYDRESFIKGELFKIGDIVEHNNRKAEIISIGTNYVTLIREGHTFKSWLTDIKVLISESKVSSPKIRHNQISYKGYTTTNFNEDISNEFVNKYNDDIDKFAYYNCMVSCDNILKVKANALIEFYHKYNNDFDKISRYTKKLNIYFDRLAVIGESLELIKELKVDNGI